MLLPLAISFDLDGTLATLFGPRIALMPRALIHPLLRRLGPAFESLRAQRHPDLDLALQRRLRADLAPGATFSDAELRAILDRDWPAAFRRAHCPATILDLIGVLDRRGIPRLVLSDHPAAAKLRAMRVPALYPERWAALVDAGRYGALKPWPDALRAAAAALGVPVMRILHVGDRPETDGAMAAQAGASFLAARDKAALRALARRLDAAGSGASHPSPTR